MPQGIYNSFPYADTSATYAYDPARPHLLATVTGPAHVVTNTWEPDHDVLDTKANQTLTGPTISAYDYTV
ncbi:MAG: hypothetical protein ACOYMN_21445 [Roseimicrobium sp.]